MAKNLKKRGKPDTFLKLSHQTGKLGIFAGTAGIMIIIGILIVAGTGIANFVILIIMLVRIFALKNLLAPYQFAQQNQMILYYLMHIIN
ncbi:hypothetical protein DR088_03335 [Mycoplasma hyopneumoniae]|uniref:hypothetical protein n=1 Tax=Mesomycoplasma hyopneumoniae TaxID=2099 RepID=UPI001C6931DB|nr:hypothetical protein [Mesomycoplasma hyopneumoniae]MXR11179.1 hypothetical protein [Mesomycoplasma hyopneumoniae]MXR64245.1 hypothetical protein [Mesomycoplasma hyopneumoniae]